MLSPGGSVVKNLPASAGDSGDAGSIPGLGRFLGGGNGNPLQYSSLENPMERGGWWATVHRVTRVGHDWASHRCGMALIFMPESFRNWTHSSLHKALAEKRTSIWHDETIIRMTWWVARRYHGHGLDNITRSDLKTTLGTNSFTNPVLVNGFVLVHWLT